LRQKLQTEIKGSLCAAPDTCFPYVLRSFGVIKQK